MRQQNQCFADKITALCYDLHLFQSSTDSLEYFVASTTSKSTKLGRTRKIYCSFCDTYYLGRRIR